MGGQLKSHKEKHSGDMKSRKQFACTYGDCNKKFTTEWYLKKHLAAHSTIKVKKPKLQCPHCEYGSYNKAHLAVHIRIHTGEKPFACTHADCNKRFRLKNELNAHFLGSHKENHRFKCPHCAFSHYFPAKVKMHVRTVHLGEKPFACSFPGCDKRYSANESLKKHMKSHYAQTFEEEKPFVCEFVDCGKRFKSRQGYKEHMQRIVVCQHRNDKFCKNGLKNHEQKLHEALIGLLTELEKEKEVKIKTEEIQIKQEVQCIKQKSNAIRSKLQKKVQVSTNLLDTFRADNEGKLPSLRHTMKLLNVGYPKAQEILNEYAKHLGCATRKRSRM